MQLGLKFIHALTFYNFTLYTMDLLERAKLEIERWARVEKGLSNSEIELLQALLDRDYLLALPCSKKVHKQNTPSGLRHLFYHHVASILGWTERVCEGDSNGMSPLLYSLIREIWPNREDGGNKKCKFDNTSRTRGGDGRPLLGSRVSGGSSGGRNSESRGGRYSHPRATDTVRRASVDKVTARVTAAADKVSNEREKRGDSRNGIFVGQGQSPRSSNNHQPAYGSPAGSLDQIFESIDEQPAGFKPPNSDVNIGKEVQPAEGGYNSKKLQIP